MKSRGQFNTKLRSYCENLWTYFHEDESGILHKKLLESQAKTKLKGKIYNTGFVGDAYQDANDAREKRHKANNGMCQLSLTLSSQAPLLRTALSTKPLSETCFLTEEPSEEQHAAPYPRDRKMYYAAMRKLNQKVQWKIGELDLLAKFNEYKLKPQSPLSLALDDIADVSVGSGFASELSSDELKLANACSASDPQLEEKWPTVLPILSRICDPFKTNNTYSNVCAALKNEDHNDPIVTYLESIVYNYSHYLNFTDELPENLCEREGFGFLTWTFIRGALTLVMIPSRCFEIPVTGSKERKNRGRDLSVQAEIHANMADAVALSEGQQIYIAESALVNEPKLDKEPRDKFKLVRCLRDSWNCQIREISRESIPPSELTVFGSTSYKDETKLLALDFMGTYRLRQVGRMLVPLRKSHFAKRMKACVLESLKFSLRMREEVIRRSHLSVADDSLSGLCDAIPGSRPTPTKEKKRRVSQCF